MVVLLLKQLQGGHLPQLAAAGAWNALVPALFRPALGPTALELDMLGIAEARLRAVGSPGAWVVRLSTPSAALLRRLISAIVARCCKLSAVACRHATENFNRQGK